MKILVVCDQGVNRSVTLAGQLKYLGHDVLSAGVSTNSVDTQKLLYDWADKVIIVDFQLALPMYQSDKVELWNIGPDVYPRPYNKDLLKIVKRLIAEHPEIRNA